MLHHYRLFMSLVLLIIGIAACQQDASPTTVTISSQTPLSSPNITLSVNYQVETVIERAEFPVSLVFTPNDYMLWSENQLGRVVLVDLNDPEKIQHIAYQIQFGEQDWNAPFNVLTGLTLDPDFENNHYVWIYYVEPEWINPDYDHAVLTVVRFELNGVVGIDPRIMWQHPLMSEDLEHREGNIQFDEEGYLYLGTGDGGEPSLTQKLNTIEGKIHRFEVTDDGLMPADDNPISDNSLWAYGLRNPFDLTVDPVSGDVYATVNGPDCDDQITRILPYGNYGWRDDYPCNAAYNDDEFVNPLYTLTPTEGITGVTFYDGDLFPEWQGDLFFCAWNLGKLRRAELSAERDRILRVEELPLDGFQCQMDIVVGNDGALYFTSLSSIQKITIR